MRWMPWVVAAALLALFGLGVLWPTRAPEPIPAPMDPHARVREIGNETICDFSEHSDRIAGAGRVALIAAGVILLLGIRRLAGRGVP